MVQKLEARCALNQKKINVLIQVNQMQEASKSGLHHYDQIKAVAEELAGCQWLKMKGLMTLPPQNQGEIRTRNIFSQVREWLDQLRSELNIPTLTELSMGMTADYQWAIMEGSTMIRVGSAIFGSRDT